MGNDMSDDYEPGPLARDTREHKLPAWAQNLINEQRRQTAEARAVARKAVLDRAASQSRVVLDPFSEAPLGLDQDTDRPWRTTVAFKVPTVGYEGGMSKIYVQILPDGKGIDVRGDEALVIHPWVTNSVRIYPVEC